MKCEELKKAESTEGIDYKMLFDAYPDAAFILGASGQVLYANRAAIQCCGYGHEFLKQVGFTDLLVSNPDVNIADHIQQSLNSGDRFEARLRNKDGNEIPVEVITSAVNYSGQQAIVASVRDVSPHKQAEEELRKLSTCVEQTGEAIIIVDNEYRIEYVNPLFTKLTGYTPEEVIGKNPSILSSGRHDIDFYRKMWHTITKQKTTWQGEVIDKRKDGSFYHAMMSITPIYDQLHNDSKFTHYIGIQHDLGQVESA